MLFILYNNFKIPVKGIVEIINKNTFVKNTVLIGLQNPVLNSPQISLEFQIF